MSPAPQLGASLAGTLQGPEVIGLMERLRQESEAALAERSQLAAEQQAQAQQALAQAVSQPPPQLQAGDTFIPQLLGDVASVLSQNQQFGQRAREDIQQVRGDLLQQRRDNLVRLQKVADQRADEARKAGDLEAEEKFRGRQESLHKQLDLLNAQLDRQNRLDVAKIGAASKPGPAGELDEEGLDTATTSVVNGETQLRDYSVRARSQIVKEVGKRGQRIMPTKVRDTVAQLGAANEALDQIAAASAVINTGSGPLGYVSGLAAAGRGILQDPDVRAFQAATRGLLAALARATGERGVLTDQDVQRVRTLLPGIYDSKEVAEQKITNLRAFIEEIRAKTTAAYTTPGAGTGSQTQSPAPAGSPAPAAPAPPQTVRMVKNGRIADIPAGNAEKARKLGWADY